MRERTGTETREELLAHVREALADGRIAPADLARLLPRPTAPPASGGPRAGRIAEALGIVVVLLGGALAYATQFGDLSDIAKLTTPFVFPAAVFAVFALMTARGRPRWELEVAAALGLAALTAALAAAWAGSGDVAVDGWGTGSAAVVAAVSVTLLTVAPRPYAAGAFLTGAAVAGANFGASVLGMSSPGAFRWLEFALAGLAVAVGAGALAGHQDRADLALAIATLLTVAGAVLGFVAMDRDITGLTPWHLVLSVTVAAAVVMAGALGMPALMAAGAAAGAVWLVFVLPVAGSSPGWALVVVLMGLVLIAAGVGGTRLRGAAGHR